MRKIILIASFVIFGGAMAIPSTARADTDGSGQPKSCQQQCREEFKDCTKVCRKAAKGGAAHCAPICKKGEKQCVKQCRDPNASGDDE